MASSSDNTDLGDSGFDSGAHNMNPNNMMSGQGRMVVQGQIGGQIGGLDQGLGQMSLGGQQGKMPQRMDIDFSGPSEQRQETAGEHKGIQETSPPQASLPTNKGPRTVIDTAVTLRNPEACLRRLAKLLGRSWMQLGTHLDFQHNELDIFSKARPFNIFALEMLNEWARVVGTGQKPTEILSKALERIGRHDLSNEIKALQLNEGDAIPAVELSDLSNKLGSKWKELATFLEIKSEKIQGIIEDKPVPPIQESAFVMLVAWYEKSCELDKKEHLRNKLGKIRRNDLVNDVMWKEYDKELV